MSWWVKEHIAVNDTETQQLCSIEADNQTSLPAADQTATAGFIIVRGSSALVLDTGDSYIMNSAGTWVQQPSGVQLDLSGYATTQELTDGLAAKVDTSTYTAGQAAQDAVIGTKITALDVYGLGTTLSAGGSMDSLPIGRFTCGNATIAAAVTNSPWSDGGFFGWTVESVRAGDRFVQIAIKNVDAFQIAKRRYTGVWSPWVYTIT